MPLRAVIFDFDGVIADTENIHIAAWQRTLAGLGWEVSDTLAARTAEIDDRVFLSELFAKRKIEGGDVEGWIRRKQQLAVSMLADSPRIFPGVPELVHSLRSKHVRLAVVSTTWRENIAVVLGAAGLADAFETIVGKEDVRAVKPDPEGYRLAVEQLRLAPADAVAIEDSATGLEAARGAGLRTLAVGHRLPRGEWSGTSAFIPDLSVTSAVLAKLQSD